MKMHQALTELLSCIDAVAENEENQRLYEGGEDNTYLVAGNITRKAVLNARVALKDDELHEVVRDRLKREILYILDSVSKMKDLQCDCRIEVPSARGCSGYCFHAQVIKAIEYLKQI